MRSRLPLAVLAVALARPGAAQPTTYTSHRDVEYARPGGLPQLLDVHVPDGPGPFPLLLWVHGGGWQGGDKSLQPSGAQLRQAKRGYVVASANYRLSGVAAHPAQIHDVKAALRWLRLHAAEFRIDPDRVGAWGSSAGGHLVALLGTSGGVAPLEGDANPGPSSRVSAVVDWYGPSDLPNMQAQGLPCSGDHSSASSPEGRMLGCAVPECPERALEASPITWVSQDDPPFHVVHGTADCTVPPLQSRTLHDALAAAGVDSALTLVEGGGHGGPQWTDATNLPLLEAFLDRTVRDAGRANRWIVPSVARTRGEGGAFWTSSLIVANPGDARADVDLRFLGHDADGTAGPAARLSLPAGASLTREDVLGALFGLEEGWGALLLESASTSLVAHVETSTPGGGGTFGQAVPAFAAADLVTADRPRSIAGLREGGAFRTNLVLANATEGPLDVDVALVAGDGTTLATARVPLPPLGMTQASRVARVLRVEGDVSGRLLLSTPTPGGAFAAYAALVDGATNDPRTLLPR
jgi:acetyl esterase/lipase